MTGDGGAAVSCEETEIPSHALRFDPRTRVGRRTGGARQKVNGEKGTILAVWRVRL
jgi:hypothetical protein